MIIQEGCAQSELFNRFGMTLPDGEPARPRGAVQINMRLKQMRAFAARRIERGAGFDNEAWLKIYAEGIARRYGAPNLERTARDATLAGVMFSPAELDDALTEAEYAIEAHPDYSSWSAPMIGKALGVTLKERMEGLTHLGCAEESADERKGRRKEERRQRRNASRRKPDGWSQESQKPWIDLGISRATWFRLRRAERQVRETDAGPVIYKEVELSEPPPVSPEAQRQATKDRANLAAALETFFGLPESGHWPPAEPRWTPPPPNPPPNPPIRPEQPPGERPPPPDGPVMWDDTEQAWIPIEVRMTAYVNTELDERLLPAGARGFAKITSYSPYRVETLH